MTQKKIGAVPTLRDLIQRTSKLNRELALVLRRFPEDKLKPQEKIFLRLLNPRWRHLAGEIRVPYEPKEAAAVEWISKYGDYIRDLEGFFSHVMLRPDLFSGLPFNGQLQLSAEECLRRLSLQEAALKRIHANETRGPAHLARTDFNSVRDELEAAVQRHGIKEVAFKAGLSPDTIMDFIAGRVAPQKATVNKARNYLNLGRNMPKKGGDITSPD